MISKITSLAIAILISGSISAQIITSTPALPTDNVPVTIYYDATLGNAGLKDYTGDVYAHTGLITDKSTIPSDWKYVLAAWSVNIEKAKMTRVSANLYSLTISPSIRSFYGVLEADTVKKMAFVFRSADGSKQGKTSAGGDIFYDVYKAELGISFARPQNHSNLITSADSMFITVNSNMSDSIVLYYNGLFRKKVEGIVLTDTLKPTGPGLYKFEARAWDEGEYVSDSVFFYLMPSVTVEDLPPGIRPGVNVLDDNRVVFSLYAPGKSSALVPGDYNNWVYNDEVLMKKTSDGNYFWLEIGGLDPLTEYGFQYVIDGNIRIPDPYTTLVLDPSNDPWISETTFPGLKQYPEGLASGLVSVFKTASEPYNWVNNDFVTPAPKDLVIYELLVRDFIASHDFKTLTDTLGYLDSLGVNVIELMPVNEFEGNSSWGYNPSMYFAVDKYYGKAEDLKQFIDACHGRGIAVVLDMVLNHAYGSNPLVQMYWDPATYKVTAENPWFNIVSPNSSYSWGYDFDHTSNATKEFIDSVNRYWIDEFKVDGFRFDFTKGFTNTPGDGYAYDQSRIDILKRMGDRIWEIKPDALLILEHFTANTEEKVLTDYGFMTWGNINFQYSEAAMGWDSDISGISYIQRGWTNPNLVGYMESHDEERMMYRLLNFGNSILSPYYNTADILTSLKRVKQAGAFFFTIPGPKMIWQFEELGYDVSIDYLGRVEPKPIRWNYFNEPPRREVYNSFSSVINLRKNYPAFTEGNFTITQTGSGGKFKRINITHPTMDVVVMANFDLVTGSVSGEFTQLGYWYEFFSGDSLNVTNSSQSVEMSPGASRIYTTLKVTRPPYIVSVDTREEFMKDLKVYPNPFTDFTTISLGNEGLAGGTLDILDYTGKIVKSSLIAPGTPSYEWNGLSSSGTAVPPGLYFIRITSGSNMAWRKVVKGR